MCAVTKGIGGTIHLLNNKLESGQVFKGFIQQSYFESHTYRRGSVSAGIDMKRSFSWQGACVLPVQVMQLLSCRAHGWILSRL